MDKRLRIECVYADAEFIEISLFAWNGRFAGSANIYLNPEELAQAAETIKGFPINPSDSREIFLGNFKPQFAGGGARLSFRCKDSAGHAEVRIQIERIAEEQESTILLAPVEAAAVDEFVRQLQAFSAEWDAEAILNFIK